MKYLLEREGKGMLVVELPEGAKINTYLVTSEDHDESIRPSLVVNVHEGETLIGSFAQVTAFYPESMEPRKREYV